MNQLELSQDFERISACALPWDHLKGKRIFITGATGFICGYLARALCWLNSQLSLGLSLGLFHRAGTAPTFSDPCILWVEGTMTENFIPDDIHPDIIIHAASPANHRAICADPVGVMDCNILATRYLLERVCRDRSTFVFFSSGEVYQHVSEKIVERSARNLVQSGVRSFYGNSKLAGGLLCERYMEEYGVDCRILRPFSVFGPGEPLMSGRCFTDFMCQAMEGHRIQVNGPGTQIRSYCYLSDFISGLLYVLLSGERAVYNIGNEENTCSIMELARQMAQLFGDTDVIGPLSADIQADCFVPDTTKLRSLGWWPRINLQDCIKRCIDSYR